MAVAYRSVASTILSTRTNITVTKPAGVVDDDILIASIAIDTDTAITPPAGWTEITVVDESTVDLDLYVYWKRASSEGANYTWTHSSAWSAGAIVAVSGAITSGDPQDATVGIDNNDGLTSTVNIPSITTATDGSLVIAVTSEYNTAITSSTPSGWDERLDTEGMHVWTKTQTTSGATGATTATLSTASNHVTAVVAIKEGVATTVEQEGFRFGVDDGSESAHGWEASQDTNISTVSPSTKLIRFLLNSTGDYASTAFKLKYQKNGAGGYATVPLTATSGGTTPLIEAADSTSSGDNVGSASWAVSTPTASTGDLLIFNISWDDSVTVSNVTAPAGKNSETLTAINATPAVSNGTEVRCKSWYCITTGAWTAGTITFTPSASEQWTAKVIRVPAGEFDGTTPIGASVTSASAGVAETNVQHGAFTAGASDGGGKLCVWTAVDVDPQTVATGFTQVANTDVGVLSGGFFHRNTVVSNSESFTATTVSTIAGDSWCAVAFVVRAPVITNDLYISTSTNITAGGEATTARLTAPSGKTTSDFVTGRRWDDENGTDSIDITTDDYTEVEFPITLRTGLTDTTYFDFRMYNVDTAIDTYTVTPRWTVASVATATGTLNKTLGGLTGSVAGTVLVSGTTSKTLGSLTKSITGSVLNNGSLSKTLGALTSVSAVDVIVQGTLDKTLGSSTLSSGGTVADNVSTGTLNKTLGSLVLSSSTNNIVSATLNKALGSLTETLDGDVLVQGTTSKTLGSLTLTSSVKAQVSGTLNKTLGSLTRSISGTVLVSGTTSKTLGATTLVSAGDVFVAGSLNKTLGSLSLSSSGSVAIVLSTGTLNKTLGVLSLVSSGDTIVSGSTVKTLGSLSASSSGDVIVTGSTSKTLGSLTLSSVVDNIVSGSLNKSLGSIAKTIDGDVLVVGTLNKTLGSLSLSSAGSIGTVVVEGSLNKTLGTLTSTSSGNLVVQATLNSNLGSLSSSAEILITKAIPLTPDGLITTVWNNIFTWYGTSLSTWYLIQFADENEIEIFSQWYTVSETGGAGQLNCFVSPTQTQSLVNGNYKWRLLDYHSDYGNWSDYKAFTLSVISQGTLSENLSPLSGSSAGTVETHGTTSKTLGSLSSSSSGTVSVSGSLSKTLGSLSKTISGKVDVKGTTSKTLGSLTLSATGGATSPTIGTLNKTLGALSENITGTVSITGTTVKTLGAISKSVTGTVLVKASVSKTLSSMTSVSSGKVIIGANTSENLGTMLSTSSGTVLVLATADEALDGIMVSSSGEVVVSGILSKTLGEATLVANGIVSNAREGILNATLGAIVFDATGTVFDAQKRYYDRFITTSLEKSTDMVNKSELELFVTKQFEDTTVASFIKNRNLTIKKIQN